MTELMNNGQVVQEFVGYLMTKKHFSQQTVRSYRTDLGYFSAFLQQRQCESDFELEPYESSAAPGGTGSAVVAVAPVSVSRQLLGVEPEQIREYLSWLRQEGYSKATIARKLACLRSFYKFLVRRQYLQNNPANGICPPTQPKKAPQYLNRQQVSKLLKSIRTDCWLGLRNKAILQTLYGTGLRVGELVALNIGDVDFSAGELHIHSNNGRTRILKLDPDTVSDLRRYIWSRNSRASLKGRGDPDALFVNRCGNRLAERTVRREMQHYVALAGLGGQFSAQSLRHSFAAHKRQAGLDLKTLRNLLGHISASSTRIYAML